MLAFLTERIEDEVIDILPVPRAGFDDWVRRQTPALRAWIVSTDFRGEAGSLSLVAGSRGRLKCVLFGLGDDDDPWAFAALPGKLPHGLYAIDAEMEPRKATWAATGWALATYAFSRYKSRSDRDWPHLIWPEKADRDHVARLVRATGMVRDLINTPAGDMGPAELADAAAAVAIDHGATCRIIVGDDLLRENYPAVHAVGRASSRAPRLIDLRWGDADAPKVTLVGKGVCFDSGGLDIKSSANMKLMKKDMGGAAHVLGLAAMVMGARLPVRLRVLIPAVENAVSGNAFRPLDVLNTRKGLTVEVGNTDAEGRLILCDALAEADAEKPAVLLDLATLTGAARSALGTELPALFANDDSLAGQILRHGEAEADPLWRLPLWKGYRRMLDSKVADLGNAPDSPYAGAITAALFLQEFVSPRTPWAHIDLMAWNPSSRPGRPEGGEAMTLRALYAMLAARYPVAGTAARV